MGNMSERLGNELAVNGLVDSRRAAELLGISVNTFKVWASRSQSVKSGVAAEMPKPVATMHGRVYLLEDIEKFGRKIAMSARAPRTAEREAGRYFTPDLAADCMTRWAVRAEGDVILEPSVGDGQFALAVQRYGRSRGWKKLVLHACELDSDVAAKAVASGAVDSSYLHVGDFLGNVALPKVDVVIGNPPFVRVRELDAVLKANALSASKRAMGVQMDKSGSVWMSFVAKATSLLKEGGRLAFVLPLDFTYVRYARPLWQYLSKMFGTLSVLRVKQRVFSDILQNVLILFADRKGGATDTIRFIARDALSDDFDVDGAPNVAVSVADVVAGERVFQRALLSRDTLGVLNELTSHSTAADKRVKFSIGYVSGNKSYFHPSSAQQELYGLPDVSLLPTVESSRQLFGAGVGTSSIPVTAKLWAPKAELTESERRYVAYGERQGVDMAYKCRIRSPWYRVPGVRSPDVLLTAFSDRPRLYLNDASWVASNSVLCGYLRKGESALRLLASWYTPLTLLTSELQIHSLGGGVMIAVPREADSVRILTEKSSGELNYSGLDSALRSNDVLSAYRTGEPAIIDLVGTEGLELVYAGVSELEAWRKSQS